MTGKLLSACVVALCVGAGAVEPAHFNYMVHCQGCHLASGEGIDDRVPPLKNQIARFLGVPGGRAFLVQVPGMSQAHLTPEQKATLLNWLLPRFDPMHQPSDFAPYTAAEVERLQAVKLDDVMAVRHALVEQFTE